MALKVIHPMGYRFELLLPRGSIAGRYENLQLRR